MYIPDIYKNENPEEIKAFLRANAFGILITNKNGKNCATHIPLELATRDDGTEILHGHISKANEQVTHLINNKEALCIFNGPHSYVSASWYDFEEVSTWNYIAVQVRGRIQLLDKTGLRKSLKILMDTYEKNQENPIDMDSLSEKTMRQIHGITGFEIEITSIEAAYKLSQNRNDKNHKEVIKHLEKTAKNQEKEVASAMKTERELSKNK